MPMFIAVHKWKPEEQITALKEVVAIFAAKAEGKFPEGVDFFASYMNTGAPGAFCIWTAPSKEVVREQFATYAPVVNAGTEIVSVVQAVPPTLEFELALVQQMIQAASR